MRRVTWRGAQEALSFVRRRVFIEEQGVPEAMEWESDDHVAIHALAENAGNPIGCGRLILHHARIGRMAVLQEWRKHGVGSAILESLIEAAHNAGLRTLELHAQTQALDFYKRFGFEPYGEEFEEAGIPHYAMSRVL